MPRSALWRLYLAAAAALDRRARLDGRIFIVAAAVAIGSFLAAMSLAGRETAGWRAVGAVPASAPARDLRSIVDVIPCLASGANPYIRNDCDVEKRPFNYPRFWLALPRIGLTAQNLHWWRLGASVVFFFILCLVLGRLTPVQGAVAAAAACAPAVWLGIETGNIDYWIFSILGAAALAFRRAWAFLAYVLLLLAAFLKLFPAAAFAAVLREPTWRRRLFIGSALAAAFGAYLAANFSDIVLMLRGTPRMAYISFGRGVLFEGAFGMERTAAGTASLVLLVVCAALALAAAMRIDVQAADPAALTSYRVGASIYLLAFSAPSSFDYRLVFLLFTLPQLFLWVGGRNRWGAASALALLLTLATLWGYRGPWTRIGLDELANWALFLYHSTALAATFGIPAHRAGFSRQ